MYSFHYSEGKQKVEFLIGLSWHPLVPDSFKKDLRPLALRTNSDLFIYRRAKDSLVGLASSHPPENEVGEGAREGQIPLAIIVSDYLSKHANALVAFPLPDSDRFFFMAQRNFFVLPGYDKVGDEAEIRKEFLETMSGSPDWDSFVPVDWTIKGSQTLALEDVLPRNKRQKLAIPDVYRLRPIKPNFVKQMTRAVGVGVLVFGAYFGYQSWTHKQAQAEQARMAAEQAAAEEAARSAALAIEPWTRTLNPIELAEACDAVLQSVGVAGGGWKAMGFTCEVAKNLPMIGMEESGLAGNSTTEGQMVVLTLRWSRASSHALISHLRAFRPDAVVADSGNEASQEFKFSVGKPANAKEQILPRVVSIERLLDLPIRYGAIKLTKLGEESEAPSLMPGMVAEDVAGMQGGWEEIPVLLESRFSMRTSAFLLASPGFRIQKFTGTFNSSFNLIIDGVQYAKKI